MSNNFSSYAQLQTYAAAAYSTAKAACAGCESVSDAWGAAMIPALFVADGAHPNTLGSALEASYLSAAALDFTQLGGNAIAQASNYDPNAVATTGGTIDGVQLGDKSPIRAISVENLNAGAGVTVAHFGVSAGSANIDGAGNLSITSCTGCSTGGGTAAYPSSMSAASMGLTPGVNVLGQVFDSG